MPASWKSKSSHLINRHVDRLPRSRRRSKSAVAAEISTNACKRNKNLGRESNNVTVLSPITNPSRSCSKSIYSQIHDLSQRCRIRMLPEDATLNALERFQATSCGRGIHHHSSATTKRSKLGRDSSRCEIRRRDSSRYEFRRSDSSRERQH